MQNNFNPFNESKAWKTKIDKKNPQFLKNHEGMSKLIADLRDKLQLSLSHGDENTVKRHLSKGQMLARERIELLLDEDSPFLEIGPLVGYGVKGCTIGGSIVAGIGLVCGVECMISSSVSTLKGGSANLATIWRGRRLGEIAMENGLPNITLLQSGGANLTQQFDVFHVGGGGFRGIARKSKARLPSIVVLFGSCTAGGAYTPGMSDYVIMVKKQAQMYLGGPPLVKMATGEIVDDEELGGAEMHCKVSGVSDFLAQDELHAIQIAREIVSNFNWKKKTPFPKSYFENVEEPLYDPEELLGIVGDNIKVPFDSREVIARIVDGSRISEFKPLYGPTLVTCWARIHGMPVGILANNGVLFSECANKGTQFIQLCNQVNIPLLFLQNITGFMVGKKYEQEGIIKNGAKLINAISNSEVPALTVIIGASYGAGNYGMSGREYKPRFLFSWPNSKCSVMGPEQLAGVLDIVFQSSVEKRGIQLTPELRAMADERKQQFIKQIEMESDVYYTSARAIDDGIIDPRDTRTILGFCLSIIHSNEIKGGNIYGVSRM